MMLATQLSLKSIETDTLLQNEVATHFGATSLISMRPMSQESSQHWLWVDADTWCKSSNLLLFVTYRVALLLGTLLQLHLSSPFLFNYIDKQFEISSKRGCFWYALFVRPRNLKGIYLNKCTPVETLETILIRYGASKASAKLVAQGKMILKNLLVIDIIAAWNLLFWQQVMVILCFAVLTRNHIIEN